MEGDCCATAVRMTQLLVRTSLSDFLKPKALKDGKDFPWFKDRNVPHDYLSHDHILRAYKLTF